MMLILEVVGVLAATAERTTTNMSTLRYRLLFTFSIHFYTGRLLFSFMYVRFKKHQYTTVLYQKHVESQVE